MKTVIKDLKKGDKFKFNDTIYEIYKSFRLWNRNDDPYLMTTGNEIFYHDELEVEQLNK